MAKLSTTARGDMNTMVHSGGQDDPGNLLHQADEQLGTLGVLQCLFKVLGDGPGSVLVGAGTDSVNLADNASSSSDRFLDLTDQELLAGVVAGVPGAAPPAEAVEGLQSAKFLDAHGCHPDVIPARPSRPDEPPPPAHRSRNKTSSRACPSVSRSQMLPSSLPGWWRPYQRKLVPPSLAARPTSERQS